MCARFGFLSALSVAALLLAVTGCSSDAPAPEASGSAGATDDADADTVTCASDPRVDTYTADLEKRGESGVLTFELVSSDPAPPRKDGNVFVVAVSDADGQPLGGTLSVDSMMPAHGHHAVTPTIAFDPATHTYTVDPVYLFMPGLWSVELDYYGDADAKGPPVDRALYYFCIEG